MQPKPIDSRRLLDIDAQNRTVEMESIQHLRSLREHKEHPAETDYDIIHDEIGRRNRDESARRFVEELKRANDVREDDREESAEENPRNEQKVPDGEKGSQLDIKA